LELMTTPAGAVQVGWLGGPATRTATTPTLVLLHGYGATERDLMSMLPVVGMMLPGVTARVLGIRGFYDVVHRGRSGHSWFPGAVATQPPDDEIAAVGDRIVAMVAEHTDSAVWLGFSQGMCAAMTAIRRRPELCRGLVALSGFSWAAPQPGDAAMAAAVRTGGGVPAFYGRDPADPAIPGYASAWALEFLRDHTRLTERSYPGMGHSLSMPEITDVVRFLRPLLAG
jgi:phospholipase/carboxylesterase